MTNTYITAAAIAYRAGHDMDGIFGHMEATLDWKAQTITVTGEASTRTIRMNDEKLEAEITRVGRMYK